MNMIAILILAVTISFQSSSECSCAKLKADEVTKRGWMSVVLPSKSVKIIQGKVVDPNETPRVDAFVEVFDKRGRVAGCKVGADGKFCFSDISSGKYELRVSQTYFDTVSMTVRVNRKNKRNENLEIALPVSN